MVPYDIVSATIILPKLYVALPRKDHRFMAHHAGGRIFNRSRKKALLSVWQAKNTTIPRGFFIADFLGWEGAKRLSKRPGLVLGLFLH